MARTGKRGQAKLTRTKVASVENNQSLEELFNIYIFAKTTEGLAKPTLKNKQYYFKSLK
jgi:integrase/recombinase XerD